jgi:hypothetical protein
MNFVKKLTIFSLLALALGGCLFAQEARKTRVVGTLGIGCSWLWIDYWEIGGQRYTYPNPTAVFGSSIEMSVISPRGFTLLFGDLMNIKIGYGLDNNIYFGAGWHYMAEKWSAGAALCFSPVLPGDGRSDCIIAGKLDATWWFTKSCGITAIMFGGASSQFALKTAVISTQLGISVRL